MYLFFILTCLAIIRSVSYILFSLSLFLTVLNIHCRKNTVFFCHFLQTFLTSQNLPLDPGSCFSDSAYNYAFFTEYNAILSIK